MFCQLKFQDPQERWPWVCNHPPDEGPVGCLQSAASVNKAASWHNPARAGVCCAFPVLWTTCPGVVVMGQSVRRLFWLFLGFFFWGGGELGTYPTVFQSSSTISCSHLQCVRDPACPRPHSKCCYQHGPTHSCSARHMLIPHPGVHQTSLMAGDMESNPLFLDVFAVHLLMPSPTF